MYLKLIKTKVNLRRERVRERRRTMHPAKPAASDGDAMGAGVVDERKSARKSQLCVKYVTFD